jgi:hypothetical protein
MSRTLRSRTGIGAGATIALCLAALSASAQERPVTSRQDRGDTVKINVSGRAEADYVQRDAALMTIDGMGGFDNGTNSVEGGISVRFDAELTEKISVVVEIARLRVDEGSGGVMPFFGSGNDVVNDITLRQAQLRVMDFLTPGVSARMGIIDYAFDVRGHGGALFLDPHRAQSITRNIIDGQDAAFGGGSMASRYGIENAAELEPVGMHLNYASGAWQMNLVLLPVVGEAGPVAGDEALYALDFWYNLDEQVGKGSRFGAILALHNIPGSGSEMFTVGAGANLVFGQLAVFAEGYLQRGEVVRDLDAEGHALSIGGRYMVSAESATWLEASFTLLSGDDDGDEESGNFVSYESVNDFLIVEDMYFGLDIDTNLTAIKIMGGTAFGVAGGNNNLELAIGLGFFTMTEEVVDTNGDDEDALGTEIDVKTRYNLSKQVALLLNFAILTGSDILEQMGGGDGNDTADDSAWLLSFGFDARY